MGTVGRPPKYKSVEEIQAKIDEYFKSCKGEPLMVDGEPYLDKFDQPILINAHPPTVTGLALALGFNSRQSLLNYQGKKDFVDTITRAKMQIEAYAEERLFDRDGQRGAEFSLKYNFRWQEPKEKDEGEGAAGGVVMIPEVGAGDG